MLAHSTRPDYVLEFDSYARRYAARGLPVHRPTELRPVYPFSIAWRDSHPTEAVAGFVQVAMATARRGGWLEPIPGDVAAVVACRRPGACRRRPRR